MRHTAGRIEAKKTSNRSSPRARTVATRGALDPMQPSIVPPLRGTCRETGTAKERDEIDTARLGDTARRLVRDAAVREDAVFCSEGNPEALNPQIVTTTTGMNAARPVFNGLVEFAPGDTTHRARPRRKLDRVATMAPSTRSSLRAGVKFHSNRDFKPTRHAQRRRRRVLADASVEERSSVSRGFRRELRLLQGHGHAGFAAPIEKIDERTVRITLNQPEAPFLANMAMPFNVIHSAEYADQMLRAGAPERLDREPIGTGPFMFVGYQKDVTVRYRAFPDYWAGRQPLDTLVFSITPNPAVRLTKLKAGECHVMAFPNPGDAAEIATNPALS